MTPQEEQKDWIKQLNDSKGRANGKSCSLNKPLMISIPNEGMIIPCEVHFQGHFIRPPVVITM